MLRGRFLDGGLRERAGTGLDVVVVVLGRGAFLQSQRLDGVTSTCLSRLYGGLDCSLCDC